VLGKSGIVEGALWRSSVIEGEDRDGIDDKGGDGREAKEDR
jgi:hypothetical protein